MISIIKIDATVSSNDSLFIGGVYAKIITIQSQVLRKMKITLFTFRVLRIQG